MWCIVHTFPPEWKLHEAVIFDYLVTTKFHAPRWFTHGRPSISICLMDRWVIYNCQNTWICLITSRKHTCFLSSSRIDTHVLQCLLWYYLRFRLDWKNKKVEVWGLVKKRWNWNGDSGNAWGFVNCVTDTEEESLISRDNKSKGY